MFTLDQQHTKTLSRNYKKGIWHFPTFYDIGNKTHNLFCEKPKV
jgi:hypothetical protein